MAKLVFDVETVGEDFEGLDATTQEVLTRWIRKEAESEKDFQNALVELKSGLGFSSLTGEIVVIGLLDAETGGGDVYFQAPGGEPIEFTESGLKYHSRSEKRSRPKEREFASLVPPFWYQKPQGWGHYG